MKACGLNLALLIGLLSSAVNCHAADAPSASGRSKADPLKADLIALRPGFDSSPTGSTETKFTNAEYADGVLTITRLSTTRRKDQQEPVLRETKVLIPLSEVEVTTEISARSDISSGIRIRAKKDVIEIKTRTIPGEFEGSMRNEYAIFLDPRQAAELGGDFRRLKAEAKRDKNVAPSNQSKSVK